MLTDMKRIGQFTIENGVYFSDPCYASPDWNQLHLDKGVCEPGLYDVYIKRNHGRVASIAVVHPLYSKLKEPIEWVPYFNLIRQKSSTS